VSKLGCRRLGKRTDGQQPQKLLVHLNSEQAASTLLAEARKLRKSDSEAVARNVVARNVFLNPDLSPAELRLAYDRRQKQRAQRHREQVTLREQLDSGQSNLPVTSVPDFQIADFPPLSAAFSDSVSARRDSVGSSGSLFRATDSQ